MVQEKQFQNVLSMNVALKYFGNIFFLYFLIIIKINKKQLHKKTTRIDY